MYNSAIQLKIKQRLNKLASNDYDNIECWQIVGAFNKAQLEWCRRNLQGLNVVQEGDEESTRRLDDFQVLLTTENIALTEQPIYFESALLPTDYLQWKRLSIKASSDCCENRSFVVYLAEQANVDELLRDKNKKPSFEWAETFCTMRSNRIQVYTNGEFFINNASLTYYRQPVKIQILNCVDPYTQSISALDVPCEFKDDIVEVLIDETVKIIAADNRAIEAVKNDKLSFIGELIPNLFTKENSWKYAEDISTLKESAGICSSETIAASLAAMRDRTDSSDFTKSTSLPFQFIIGKKDNSNPFELNFPMTAFPKTSFTLLLDNIAHLGFIEERGKTLFALGNFLKFCREAF